MDEKFTPCYSENEPVVFCDYHKLIILGWMIEQDDDYMKRHTERLEKIKQLEEEDTKDNLETGERICMEKYGMSRLEYLSRKG